MFNSSWVSGKGVNGQSIDYQYVEATVSLEVVGNAAFNSLRGFTQFVNLNAQAELTATPLLTLVAVTELSAITTINTFSNVYYLVVGQGLLETSSEITTGTNRIRGGSNALNGLALSTVTARVFVSKISAPPQRCFKVGPYTANFYVDGIYKDQAA